MSSFMLRHIWRGDKDWNKDESWKSWGKHEGGARRLNSLSAYSTDTPSSCTGTSMRGMAPATPYSSSSQLLPPLRALYLGDGLKLWSLQKRNIVLCICVQQKHMPN